MASRRAREEAAEGGFSLVELAVVLAVISVLLGIALPTYLGTRAGAEDQAAKSVAMIGVKAHHGLHEEGTPVAVDALRAAEPNLDVAELDSDGRVPAVLGRVYVRLESDEGTIVVRSRSGHCFWTRDADSGIRYGENDCSGWPEFTTSW